MTSINLFESAQGKNEFKQGNVFSEKTFLVPLIVLIVIIVIFGGAKLYLSYLSGQNEKIIMEKNAEAGAMSGKNVDRVADFNERMLIAAKESSSINDYGSYLSELEGLMVGGARAGSFNYSSNGVEIKIIADNFKTVARQIMSFEGSKNFNDLKVGSASRDKDGNIELTLKK